MPDGAKRAIGSAIALMDCSLGQGEILFRQGDPVDAWFEVMTGTLRTCRFYADGQRQVTGFHAAGDQVGIERDLYWASAEVVSESCTVRRFPLDACGRPLPDLFRAWCQAEQRALLLGRRGALPRMAAFLLLLARQSSGKCTCRSL